MAFIIFFNLLCSIFLFLSQSIAMCIPCFFTISTAEVGVVERFGKFSRLVQPGLSCVVCPVEQLVGRLSFRVQQLDVRVETKTLDNVFLTAVVSVQYQILREKVYDAFYALTNPTQQITAHVYDVMRSELPTLELDAVFECKEELALSVKAALTETMTNYGYQILQTLITDLDPDQRVKAAMNEINSSKRLKFAIAERAEGDKILQVKVSAKKCNIAYFSKLLTLTSPFLPFPILRTSSVISYHTVRRG
jgi:regulator of protease activity HflC (stomatin/prohibitin superfamily)